jgi:hypothetical protein
MIRTVQKSALVLALILAISGVALAGQRHATTRSRFVSGSAVAPSWVGGVQLQRRYYYPFASYYIPYQVPVLVISPYGPSYYVPPAVVVTAPYFCVFHNDGFVSRIGLLDHLAGTHKIPLDAAATICPDGVSSCVFPSY